MLALEVRDWRTSRLNAVEEVPHMIDDCVKLSRPLGSRVVIKTVNGLFVAWQRMMLQLFDWFALDCSTVHKDASLVTREHNPIAPRVAHCQLDSIGVFVAGTKIQGDVKAIRQ